MKFRKLLIASLLLNACLLALFGYLLVARGMAPEAATGAGTHRIATADAATAAGSPKAAAEWAAIRSSDWKQYVKNLRATGCPEETVRDIIFSEVNKSYAARWRSLNGDDGKKYWVSKREGWWGHMKQKQFNELEREKKQLIQELLGVDADAQLRKYLVLNYDANVETRQLDFLPEERRQQLSRVLDKDYKAVQAVWLKQEPGGGLPPAAQHELNVAMQKQKADLAQMLSPAELEEYELRNSALAKDLRRQLYGFDATEKEYRDIFEAQKVLHDKFANDPYNSTDENANEKRAAAADAAEQQIREALGERRYGDYLRAKSAQYQQLLNFTDEFELTKETANQAYEIVKRAGEQLKQLQADKSLSTEERQGKIGALQAETDQALIQVIGEKGLKYYKQNYGGWMGNTGR
jgi:hypothetical protein